MEPAHSFHMSPDEFRRAGKRLIDWIASYYESVEKYPVLSQVAAGEVRGHLPPEPPQKTADFDSFLAEVESKVLPGITHWQSPNFFAYFPANSSGPAVLGELLSAALGVQGMLWTTSPACTEVETHLLDWLVKMLDLPEHFLSSGEGGGVIQDSASSATLCAIVAARELATGGGCNEEGCRRPLVAYTSNQAHSSVEKGIKAAGIGRKNLRLIDVDTAFAMQPAALEEAIKRDLANKLEPFFVSATVGTTSSLAVDPLPEIGKICRRYKLWLHVDAAMAGTAALCPELRHIHAGLEYADSYCFNPHKWMFTNFDCTAFYVKQRKALIDSLSIVPEYLRNRASASGGVIDYRDWHLPLGRRFRALKLWAVIRHYGIAGLQFHLREHVALAQEFAQWVKADDRFELAAPVSLNLVCFRLKGDDAPNERLVNRINQSGKMFFTHTKLAGKYALRFCVGQTRTQRRHVEAAWALIREHAAERG